MTILLEIIAVAAVIFVAAAYVAGRYSGLAEAEPDATPTTLPEGRLAPEAVDQARFGLAFRGYRMADVDGVLDRLRDELADRDAELAAFRGADDGPLPRGEGAPTAHDRRPATDEGDVALRATDERAQAPDEGELAFRAADDRQPALGEE